MDVTVKKMETEDEILGKAFVHWKTWHAAYAGMVSADYLDRLTLPKCEELAHRWTDGLLVAKIDGRVVGFIGVGTRDDAPDVGEVFALYVLPEYHGTGVAQRLMAAGLEALDGYREVCLWVLRDNARAIRFYQKCGFAPTGEEMYSDRVKASEIRMALAR